MKLWNKQRSAVRRSISATGSLAIRIRRQLAGHIHDIALFDLAVDCNLERAISRNYGKPPNRSINPGRLSKDPARARGSCPPFFRWTCQATAVCSCPSFHIPWAPRVDDIEPAPVRPPFCHSFVVREALVRACTNGIECCRLGGMFVTIALETVEPSVVFFFDSKVAIHDSGHLDQKSRALGQFASDRPVTRQSFLQSRHHSRYEFAVYGVP